MVDGGEAVVGTDVSLCVEFDDDSPVSVLDTQPASTAVSKQVWMITFLFFI